ncbi:MAG: AAA family ATPase [Gemmataceae bacterium]
MIESHFGLSRRPFPATPDQSTYYPATSHEKVLARLQEALADGEGMLLLTAAPGLGKTLLSHVLLERLGSGYETSFLIHTHLRDRAGLLQALLFDLSLPHEGRSEQEMRLALIDHLLGKFREGRRSVLIIDEAQHLTADLLEELRLLGNLEGQGGKAVQVILVAQPDLLHTLGHPGLLALRQRLAVRLQLDPLGLEEAADYLLAHLRSAGGRAERILGMETLEVLARQTGGVPRLLNQAGQVCLRLAAENQSTEVDVEMALEAMSLLGLSAEPGDGTPAASEESVLRLDGTAEAGVSDYRLFMTTNRSA